jgi:hypothetical protein
MESQELTELMGHKAYRVSQATKEIKESKVKQAQPVSKVHRVK